ncbi:MAG: cytochrome C oxidase subunit IV family protein [Myxococcota bacterium]
MTARAHPSHFLTYSVVWGALVVLTGATYGVAHVDVGDWNLLLALAIASFKSALVVLFFMHLKEHGPTNRAYFVVAVLFVALLVGLTVADVATRPPFTNVSAYEQPELARPAVSPGPRGTQGAPR